MTMDTTLSLGLGCVVIFACTGGSVRATGLTSNSNSERFVVSDTQQLDCPRGEFAGFDFSRDYFLVSSAWRPPLEMNLASSDFSDASFVRSTLEVSFSSTGTDVLRIMNFDMSDFTGADFTRARFSPELGTGRRISTIVSFNGAEMDKAIFTEATLEPKANTGSENTSAVEFRGASLVAADFSNAIFNPRIGNGVENRAVVDFSAADLTGAEFSGAQFRPYVSVGVGNRASIDFNGATLDGAIFSNATFTLTNIDPNNFSTVDFGDASLRGVDFTGAAIELGPGIPNLGQTLDFSGANLVGANLSSLNLEQLRFDQTIFSESTVFPSNFDPFAHPGLILRPDQVLQPISSIFRTPTGQFRITMPPVYGRRIGIEYSPDMSSESWIELGNFDLEGSEAVFVDPDLVRQSRNAGYYRAFLRELVR